MKKVLSVLLAMVMLITTMTMGFSALAEEEMTVVYLGSEIENANENVAFDYEVYINNEPVEYVYNEEETPIYIGGFLEKLPAGEYVYFEAPVGASYQIVRLPYSESGYEAIPEEIKEGVVDPYEYSEEYTLGQELVENALTRSEYLEKTKNDTEKTDYFYYNTDTKETLDKDKATPDVLYSESTREEIEHIVGYPIGSQTEYPVHIDVTAKLNVNKPITTIGVPTYYYSGKITLKVNGKEVSQEYPTVPSRTLSDAKTYAVSNINNIIRTLVANSLDELVEEKDTSIFLKDSINSMMPTASSLSELTTEETIINKDTKAIECIPYDRVDIKYSKEDLGGVNISLGGELVREHTHAFIKGDTIAPTCSADGYTAYNCSECSKTEKRDIVPANENAHSFTKYVSNNDAKLPTCTEAGSRASQTAKCDYCDKTDTKAGDELSATGHISGSAKQENYVAATCTKAGSYDEVTTCIRCQEVVKSEHITIDKLAHNYVYTKTVAPTCTAKGYKLYKCADCSATKKDTYTDKKAHTYKITKVTKAPTSSATGKCTKKCTACGATTTATLAKLAKASISSISALSKGFKVSWKKVSSATGYEIQYSTSSKFSKPTTKAVTKNSTVSLKVAKLSAKKKYYVRIRTYTTINGKKYYSSWSTAKTVTTKK